MDVDKVTCGMCLEVIRKPRELLSRSGHTVNEIRSKISGLHFSKEALRKGEREILELAEAALFFFDQVNDKHV